MKHIGGKTCILGRVGSIPIAHFRTRFSGINSETNLCRELEDGVLVDELP